MPGHVIYYVQIDESALTGESLPVEKQDGDLAYGGSIVKQGEMDAVITRTGMNSYFGRTAKLVSEAVKVPVIGIGAGPKVDGQVLVTYDMIGLFDKFVPKFVKQYTQIRKTILKAFKEYKEDVLTVKFPGPEHSFKMPDDALGALKKLVES